MNTQYALFIVLLALGGCSANSFEESQYKRSDCIVGFTIDWGTRDNAKLQEINRKLATMVVSEEIQNRYPIAGMAYPSSRDRYYIQYSDDCEAKYELTASLISEFAEVNGVVGFDILKRKVKPSPETIDIQGPAWRDEN